MVPLAALALVALAAQEPAFDDVRAVNELSLPALTADSLDEWRARVRPSDAELGYLAIPWLASFAEGLERAEAQQKPLLLWAMNGHPLGCT